MATNRQRTETTRRRILDAARDNFLAHGYENTHTDSVLEQAGISRGALYHHFASKRELFEAVFSDCVKKTVAEASRFRDAVPNNGLGALVETCLRWLNLVRVPDTASILLIQGPQVLGWERVRSIENEWSLKPMIGALNAARDAEEISVDSVPMTALLINAVLGEIALADIHRKPRLSRKAQERVFLQFINGLRNPPA